MKIIKRSYGLSEETIAELKTEFKKTKKIPNPHRDQCYGWIFSALLGLGKDAWHSWDKVADRVKTEATGAKWQKFQRKEDADGNSSDRLFYNCLVLQRSDYGMKIFDLKNVIGGKGVVIDLERRGEEIFARLNTDSATPMKLGRVKKEKAVKAPKVAKKARKVKAAKPASKSVTPIMSGADAVAFLKGKKKAA